jgi:photosystem II stability/assembly factor-like uncharacterized protein
MRRPLLPILFLAGILSLTTVFFLFYFTKEEKEINQKRDKAMSIRDAFEDNFERTKDPALGYPPVERLLDALEQTRRMQAEWAARNSRDNFNGIRWREKGPDNIGGRTRAIMIDRRDPERKTIWAGGVAGGLWKTDDITATPPVWNKVNDYLENMAVGALEQDPNNPEIIYMGTGEGYPNWEAVAGLGIFKSTDGGQTWALLPTTLTGLFRYTQDILVHPATGDIYAGTQAGLFRSQDGGATWNRAIPAATNFYDVDYIPASGMIYASNSRRIYRSATGDQSDWEALGGVASGFPQNFTRVEMAVSPSNPDWIYVIGNVSGGASNVFFTNNGGQSWVQRGLPAWDDGGEFTNGQAWYDLEIAVHPTNPTHVIAGGVPLMQSTDGGLSWQRFANNSHVDQHIILFDEENPDIIYFGNDGGVYMSRTGAGPVVLDKNYGYNVTQFYACAIHPEPFSNYMLGGTQDNNSLQLNDFGVTSARNVRGGDGFLCHIDENEPNIQMVSSQFGNYGLSLDGGRTFNQGAASFNGRFLTPSDYDSEQNILYAQTNDGDFYRWKINESTFELVDIPLFDLNVSTITVDVNTPNRVYFGTSNGTVIRVDDAHTGETVQGGQIGTFSGTISSVEVEYGNPDHLLVTISNYGVASVFESKNGGQNWTNVEGDLPDMPVRWGIFNPNNSQQAMIATEAGVWVTELLDGNNTQWIPPSSEGGIPLVRTDMLRVRRSDKVVLAATHGRGLFTTDIFADPAIRVNIPSAAYSDAPVQFFGEQSYRAEYFQWTFGDGQTGSADNPVHIYDNPGTYTVTLKTSDQLTAEGPIKILPDVDLPYVPGKTYFGGDLEGLPEQFGVYTLSGTPFELGRSTFPGKDGAHSGNNAFVLGLNEEFYQPNTHSMLYLPNFDFSEQSIYEFSFWAKYRLQGGLDGFLVEYSTDRGQTWQRMGTNTNPNWYNFLNEDRDNAAFPSGTPFFTGARLEWTRYKLNISSLSGNENVAFRFVFRSEGTGNHTGVAIDDIEITKYEGELSHEVAQLPRGILRLDRDHLELVHRA